MWATSYEAISSTSLHSRYGLKNPGDLGVDFLGRGTTLSYHVHSGCLGENTSDCWSRKMCIEKGGGCEAMSEDS